MKRVAFLLAVTVLFVLSGCGKSSYEFFVNPDGSGKLLLEARADAREAMTLTRMRGRFDEPGPAERDPDRQMRAWVATLLKQHRGVTAWKDIKVEKQEDKWLHVSATGYFPQISKVRLPSLSEYAKLNFAAAPDGSVSVGLEFKNPEEDDAAEEDGVTGMPTQPAKLTDEQAAARAKQLKANFQEGMTEVNERLKDIEVKFVVHFPNPIKSANNFEKVDDQTVRLVLNAEKAKKFLAILGEDEQFWLDAARQSQGLGSTLPKDMNKYYKGVLGQEGGIQASSQPAGKPLFDYAAESKDAAAAYKAWREELEPKLPPPLGPKAEFSKLKIAGVQYVFKASSEQAVRPFLAEADGLKLAVMGKLPGSVLHITDSILTAFEDDTGESLITVATLKAASYGAGAIRNIQFSRDRTILLFDICGGLPGPAAKGFKRIEGKLTYLSAAGSHEVEIGPLELKKGVKDAAGQVTVDEVERRNVITLTINLPRSHVKSLSILDEEDNEVEADLSSYGGMRGEPVSDENEEPGPSGPAGVGPKKEPASYTQTVYFYRKAPAKIKLVMQVYDGVSQGELTFKIENTDLFGNPKEKPAPKE